MAVNNNVKFYTISSANFPETKYTSANFPDCYKGIFVHLTDDKTNGTGDSAKVVYKKGLYFGGYSGWEYLTNDSDLSSIEEKIATALATAKSYTDQEVKKVTDSYVTSVGGKKGAITLDGDNTANGTINLAISEGGEISASINGLGSAAYTDSTAYATSAQGTKADSAIQTVKVNGTALTPDANKAVNVTIATGTDNGNIKVNGTDVAVKGLGSAAYKGSTNAVTAGSADLVESGAVKTYIDTTLTGASYYLGTITKKTDLSTTAKKGDFYRVSEATVANWGTGSNVHVGDILIAEKDNPTASVDGTNWSLLHNELNTDTDTKVTSVDNHYTPTATTADKIDKDASSTTKATWGSTSLVTGVTIERDAKGHVTNMTLDSIQMPANPNTDTITTVTGSDGTTTKTGVTVTATDGGSNGNHAYTITSEMVWLNALPTPTA